MKIFAFTIALIGLAAFVMSRPSSRPSIVAPQPLIEAPPAGTPSAPSLEPSLRVYPSPVPTPAPAPVVVTPAPAAAVPVAR